MSNERHYAEELQLLMDNRLDDPRAETVRAHLAGCAQCRGSFEDLLAIRAAVRAAVPMQPPQELSQRIAAMLQAERAAAHPPAPAARPDRLWRFAAAFATAALLAALMLQVPGRRDVVDESAAAVMAVAARTLPLEVTTPSSARLESGFAARGIRFPARVFDLQMMGYVLVGGRRHQLAGQPSALYVYRGPSGIELVCQMFEADIAPYARGSLQHERNGIRFHVHTRGNLTLVYWAEGAVVCVLASAAAPETVIELAVAKAMRV